MTVALIDFAQIQKNSGRYVVDFVLLTIFLKNQNIYYNRKLYNIFIR